MDFERRKRDDARVVLVLSLVPDALIALAFMKLIDDRWETFWWTLAVLFVLYSLIGLKDLIWSTLVWRLWGRRREVERITAVLKESNLPKPDEWDLDAERFFANKRADTALPCDTRMKAAEGVVVLSVRDSHGFMAGLRMRRAWDEAFAAFAGRPFSG